MAIPDFQTVMRPLLEEYADGQERPIADARQELATRFGLSADELAEQIPSGRAKTWQNRVGWATSYLYNVGALDRTRRSVYRITARGRTLLTENPDRVDLRVLAQFPEHHEFRSQRTGGKIVAPPPKSSEDTTPEETIDAAYLQLRAALARDLLDRIASQSPDFFEDLVLDVLQKMGYGGDRADSRRRLGRSGDGGIDGVIEEDRLGLDVIYVQAKRWSNVVGRPVVQGFVGALTGAQASKGVLITTSTVTADAKSYADNVSPRVVLVDGRRLAELMIEHNVGVTTQATYRIRRVDEDYFTEPD